MNAANEGNNPSYPAMILLYHETVTIASVNSNKMCKMISTLFVHFGAKLHRSRRPGR